MSLIFQSLQKLTKHQEAPPPGIGDPVPGEGNASSKRIRWLLPVAIGLVLSLALGSGAVYAVQYLKDRLPEKVRPSDRFERRDREPRQEISSTIGDTVETTVEVEPVAVSPSVENEIESTSEPVEMPQYQYHPPLPETPPAEHPSMAKVEPRDAQTASISTATATVPSTALPTELSTVATKPHEAVAPAASPVVDAEREAHEQARRAALAKSARIGRLVRQIEQALAGSAEAGDPSVLLKKLARLKGENHPYVVKLRAYHNFQRGKVALAEADLHKVIAAQPDDLEAGINLALIEIHDQRYDSALVRLKALRQVYPENERIADLIKRLK